VSHAADVQILVDVVDHLRLRRVALLGQSHGAPMAATYAADHPRAVSHLVLDGMTRFRGEVDARWTALRALLLADWQVGSLAMASVMLAGASSEEIAAFARLWRCCVSAEMAVALNDVAILHDLSDVFARLRVPTLVVSRRDDPLLAPEESRRVAMQISGAELVILGTFQVPERRYAAGTAYLRGQGRGRVRAVHGVDELQQEIGHLVVEARLPEPGQPASSGYEGEGYIIVRDPDTEVVRDALRRIINRIRIELVEAL